MNGLALSAPGTAANLARPEGPLTFEQMELRELALAKLLPTMDDIAAIEEERRKIAALEHYLEGKQAHLPARGAQRRLEARIGQLLGPTSQGGRPTEDNPTHAEGIERPGDKADFRILARALDGKIDLSREEWRQSRRALVALIRARTTPDEPAMAEPVQPVPVHGARIALPEGLTAEATCRQGLALEDAGLTPVAAAARLGLDTHNYRRMRDIVMLADRGGLAERDAGIVAAALDTLNDTAQVGRAWKMAEPVARRVWGEETRGSHKRDLERKRLDRFEHAFGILMQACETGSEIDVPYLDRERAEQALAQLTAAGGQLRSLGERIKELHG
jgi:hypothetical protein